MDFIKKLSKAAGRNIVSAIDLARDMYKKSMMTGVCFEILERHPELFNNQEKKKLTETDYVVRLWAPMLFALFEDCRKLNLTCAKIHHMKPEVSLLQCAGTEADILLIEAVDKKFTIAKRSTEALHISSNLAPDKLISVYNCFLQYKFRQGMEIKHFFTRISKLTRNS
ncbi:hypothetical protein BDB00DRAFT_787409 [Zychaea mexicana]|uniref:uncharacterized protein n=1 Tax=Zychaea mexicana TaxID=64656 RepID=UPI0022FEDFCE|nr:uncharacterized protein BDB00DRAFT_787409 [Zychaea mexicana]KAI9494200.1 hypothetical protein BDB00DRAFT_787409 [Zychaea mexicana]